MQYRQFRFDNYLMEMTPITHDKMSVRVCKLINNMFQSLEQIMSDASALNLFGQFQNAADEEALDAWYANLLTTLATTINPV